MASAANEVLKMSSKETPVGSSLPCDPSTAADFARVYLNEDERHGMIERNLGLVKVVVDRMKFTTVAPLVKAVVDRVAAYSAQVQEVQALQTPAEVEAVVWTWAGVVEVEADDLAYYYCSSLI